MTVHLASGPQVRGGGGVRKDLSRARTGAGGMFLLSFTEYATQHESGFGRRDRGQDIKRLRDRRRALVHADPRQLRHIRRLSKLRQGLKSENSLVVARALPIQQPNDRTASGRRLRPSLKHLTRFRFGVLDGGVVLREQRVTSRRRVGALSPRFDL